MTYRDQDRLADIAEAAAAIGTKWRVRTCIGCWLLTSMELF